MDFAETKNYDDVMRVIRSHYGIYTNHALTSFYGKTLRPPQLPSKDIQIDYANRHIKEFKEYVKEYYDIDGMVGCGKRRLTEYASRKALAHSLLSWDSRRQEKRRYYCEKCNAWHLTSKPNNKIN